MAIESQEISWKDRRMRVLIIDPSPLARNVYRLILHRVGQCKIFALDAVNELDREALNDPSYDLVILGGRAFIGDRGKLRALLTDVPAWQRLPKIVVALTNSSDRKPAWDGLAQTVIVQRPFHPSVLMKAIKQHIKGT